MAKSFFKKGKKSKGPMQSQILGIVWLSMALLFIAGLAIFLPKEKPAEAKNDTTEVADTAILAAKEDSVYRSRRTRKKHESNAWKQTSNKYVPADTFRPATRQPLVVELNSVDTTTLQLLHGIGPAYASRIVRYRERLGGFTRKEQLLEIYGFTPELLAHIAPHITVDTQAISKIDLNSITLKQLIKHPYIEYYQARDIIRLRDHGVRFNSADDLRAVPSMADSTLQRLLPYLTL